MKLCSYVYKTLRSYGLYQDDGKILDLKVQFGAQAPHDLCELLEMLDISGKALDAWIVSSGEPKLIIDPADVTWLPPLPKPGKVVGVALNNLMAQKIAYRPSETPAFFIKPNTSLLAHKAEVQVHTDYGITHPEPELAVIIGKKARNIDEAQALEYVFGYSIINDITSPGLKERDSLELIVPKEASGAYLDLQSWRNNRDEDHKRSIYLTYHALSKGADGFGPMGPWIVTKDEIPNPNDLSIYSYIGDELVFQDSTAQLTFKVEKVLAHLSKYMTLEPGDVVHMGTAMKAVEGGKFPLLTHWDITKYSAPMKIEIQGIGTLVNPVVVEDSP